MASTYNNLLNVEEIGTGEQAGTWGDTTNINIADTLPEAITGRATASITPPIGPLTLSYTESNASQAVRNLVLNITSSGSLTGTSNVIVPNRQKQYFVENNTSGGHSIVVKTAAGTGVTIPNGKIANVYCDGTNVRFADNTVGDLSVTGTLSTTTGNVLLSNGTVSVPPLAAAADTNTGLYFPAADQVALTAGGVQILRASYNGTTGAITASGDLLVGDGTVSAPSIADANQTNTGIYFPSDLDTNLAIALQGEKAFEIESLVYLGETIMGSQTFGLLASAPDEKGLITCGRYDSVYGGSAYNTSGGATFMAFQIENIEKARITDAGDVGIGTASPLCRLDVTGPLDATYNANMIIHSTTSTVKLAFNPLGPASSGIGSVNAGLVFYANGANVERMRITSAGNVGINVASDPTDRLMVLGSTTDNTASTVNFRNSASTELLRIRNDGVFYTGTAALSPYNNTTGSAANVFIGASGDLYRSTSSIKYKTDVTDYDKGLAAVMAMRPIYYKDNRTDENKLPGDQRFAGLIAEEVHAAGLQEFVQYNAMNEPDALSYGNMAALFTKAIQELKTELDAVKAELVAMKGN